MEIKVKLPENIIMGMDLAKAGSHDTGVISILSGMKPQRSKYEPYRKVRALLRAINTNNITKAIDVLSRHPWALRYIIHYSIVANWYVNFIDTYPDRNLVSVISRAQGIRFAYVEDSGKNIVDWAKKHLTDGRGDIKND